MAMEKESLKAFSVAHFIGDNTVEAVPSNWFNEDQNLCYWPDPSETTKLKKLKSNADSTPASSWSCFNARVLKSFGMLKRTSYLFIWLARKTG